MHIIDTALARREKENNPVKVGMVGAGFMAKGIALQLLRYVQGISLVAISNRRLEQAAAAYHSASEVRAKAVSSVSQLEANILSGVPSITEDPMLLCDADNIDVIVEVTGAVEFGAHIVMRAIAGGKHVVLMNAELDGTVGPILKTYADKAGVVITNVDGDQPGVIMNLYRFVKGMGVKPVLCGNIKGLQDPYRNPTTQAAFAKQWKQKPNMVTSFADGSKISFEQALVANATGMRVAKRGMYGPTVEPGTHITQAASWYPEQDLLTDPGIVDYVVQAEPGPGVFILGMHDDPVQQHYLALYKLGTGPFYCFYTPYHLCHLEVHNTIARAALFNDAAITPDAGLRVDVVATAKKDLEAGDTLDGIGQYMIYGQAENAETVSLKKLLPMGLAEGCILVRDVAKDSTLCYGDVVIPDGRLIDRLRSSQNDHFFKAFTSKSTAPNWSLNPQSGEVEGPVTQ